MIREHTYKKSRTNLKNQVKKHETQMIKQELYNCSVLAKTCLKHKGIQLSEHLKVRLEEKNLTIDIDKIIETINDRDLLYNIHEYNETEIDDVYHQRLLINTKGVYTFYCEREQAICKGKLKIVYSVTTGKIITAYLNKVNDNHHTLNLANYNSKLIVRPYRYNGYNNINGGLV